MADPIEDKVSQWNRTDIEMPPVDFPTINLQINFLAAKLFNDYDPCEGTSYPPFLDRLAMWLDNLSEKKDQKTLFRCVPEIFFVGLKEFKALDRAAFNWPIARWLIEQIGMRLDAHNPEEILRNVRDETWFCAITDSMNISRFYHVNGITGREDRPNWLSLAKLGDTHSIQEYMTENGIRFLVLLEDFIGSGTQMRKAVEFAATSFNNIPVLVVPLIICHKGVDLGMRLQRKFNNVTFYPLIHLPHNTFVTRSINDDEAPLIPLMRDLINRLYYGEEGKLRRYTRHNPFGFKGVGGLVVMHTNCPNNTLPIIHRKYGRERESIWKPLFPRSTRI